MKTRIIDLHAHPHLKMSILPYLTDNFHALTYNGAHWNPLGLRYQYRNLKRSPVKVVFNTHYVVEQGFLKHGIKPHSRAILWSTFPWNYHKMRSAEPWETLRGRLDGLEKAVRNTNRFVFGGDPRLRLVKSAAEIEGLGENEIGVAHAIEGAHIFGDYAAEGLAVEAFWERTLRRLQYLQGRGVAMIGLGHFWDTPFAPQTDSTELIPKRQGGQVVRARDDLLFAMKRADWKWGQYHGLGERLVRAMMELGILCDLAHVQDEARWAVYDLAAEYNRPAIVSHAGFKAFYDHEYNLSDEELRRLHKLGGVVGMIFSKRLLVEPVKMYKADTAGLPVLVEMARHARDLVGDVSCLAIGTDFDGFTHPFSDCPDPSGLGRLAEAMSAHFSDQEIDDVLYGNAWRAIRRGWGPAEAKAPAGRVRRAKK